MATLSSTAICNMALTKLGAERITSLTQDHNNARICNAEYEHVRNAVLTDHIWTFAQKRFALVATSETPAFTEDLMTVVYSKPTDFLQLNFVNIEEARVKVEGNRILSDTSNLKIKYTYEVTDTSLYHPKFVEAFATRLAAEIAIPIKENAKTAERLFAIYYDKKLPAAIAIDSMQGSPIQPMQDEWIMARRQGASQLIGRPGYETWYPYCCSC